MRKPRDLHRYKTAEHVAGWLRGLADKLEKRHFGDKDTLVKISLRLATWNPEWGKKTNRPPELATPAAKHESPGRG